MSRFAYTVFCLFLSIVLLIFAGCGYQIHYRFNEQDVAVFRNSIDLVVGVATFADYRESVERDRKWRRQTVEKNLSDYTYDRHFKGEVADQITCVLIDHLNFTGIFSKEVHPLACDFGAINDSQLDQLYACGIDAVLTGTINHFYGYYDSHIGRNLLYGIPLAVAGGFLFSLSNDRTGLASACYGCPPGLVLGTYLESRHTRRIEKHVQLTVRLVDTGTRQVIFEEIYDMESKERRAEPGLYGPGRKIVITTESLRAVLNSMVANLSARSDLFKRGVSGEQVVYNPVITPCLGNDDRLRVVPDQSLPDSSVRIHGNKGENGHKDRL